MRPRAAPSRAPSHKTVSAPKAMAKARAKMARVVGVVGVAVEAAIASVKVVKAKARIVAKAAKANTATNRARTMATKPIARTNLVPTLLPAPKPLPGPTMTMATAKVADAIVAVAVAVVDGAAVAMVPARPLRLTTAQ